LALLIATVRAVTTGSVTASPSESCRPPSYQIVKTRWDQDSSEGVAKRIVIALRDFAPERLLCLVQSLERRYNRPKYVSIEIFSSVKDARTCFPDIPLGDAVFTCPQRHAEYEFNAISNQRFIHLLPMGSPTWGGEDTLVNLPATTLRPCRLELDHRCVLEVKNLDYPDDMLDARVSGSVTVIGTISRQGNATTIEVLDADARDVRNRRVPADVLARAVTENVGTWQFEALTRETTFRITFDFEMNDNAIASVEFRLPSRIIVRGDPTLLLNRPRKPLR